MIPKHVSGKSRRRAEVRQRTKKRFFKGGHIVIDEMRNIDPEAWTRLKAVTDYLKRPDQGSGDA
jgi:hypothetical protein